MEEDMILLKAITIELAALGFIITAILALPSNEASYFRLYELLGAFLASIITTSGLYGMKKLT